MKNLLSIIYIIYIILGFFIGCLIFSCKKEPITPGNYGQPIPPPIDTTHWQNQYTNGGTIPNFGGNITTELVGTIWVLTKLQTGFSSTLPIDTIKFIDNTYYTINNNAVKPYQLTSGVASNSKTLTLNYHYPFGSGNYAGEVAGTFVTDSVIDNIEFKNIQTTSTTIRAWFKRIK